MKNNELYRYLVAVRAIMKEYGKMEDADFIEHVATCCKEAEGLTTTLEEEIYELTELKRQIESLISKKKKELFERDNRFDIGEHILFDQCGNGKFKEGIYLGNRMEYGNVVPIVAKLKKDGTQSKNHFYNTFKTVIKKK